MPPTRRHLLQGLGATALIGACRTVPPAPLNGAWSDEGRAARGHRLRSAFTPTGSQPEGQVDVIIVGAGVAGLSAAWRLAADPSLRVAWLELDERPGGTARAGHSTTGPHPTGAHYVTIPSAEHRVMRRLLTELGVLSGTPPTPAPRALCMAPQERLYVDGAWQEGLWPTHRERPTDRAQREAFAATVAALAARTGADGLPAFSLPVAHSSHDPELRSLAEISMADWLDREGLDSPLLHAWLRYAVRDDFGTELDSTSAWAGLHYHCARRPWVARPDALGTEILTWPGGNGWLVEQLLARLPWEPTCGALVRQVEPEAGRVFYEVGDEVRQLDARAVILAVPQPVADALTGHSRAALPDAAPWVVASLHVEQLPASRGVSTAWDSVVYEGKGLGYVTNTHQQGRYGGPAVLSWYQPLSEGPVREARHQLLALSWEELVERVFTDLEPAHPDLRRVLRQVDGWRWGHGTVRPVPGLHASGHLDVLAAPLGRVHRAHTDLSGMSLFEEALFHGVHAAEEVLGAAESWL